MIFGPVGDQFIGILQEAGGQASRIRGTQCGCFMNHRTNYRLVQNVGLELHQQVVCDHAAIGAQICQLDAGILLHCIQNFTNLVRSGFQNGACDVSLVDVAG